jgi:hypothetical protein
VPCTQSSTPSIMASRDIAPARRHEAIRITDEIAIYQKEIEERFVRASGPGGQHVNKVSTAVELRVDIIGSSLPAHVKQRLATLAGGRMTGDGLYVPSDSAWPPESRSFGKAKMLRSLGVVPFCTGGPGLVNRLTNVGTVLGAIKYARGSRWESGATAVR